MTLRGANFGCGRVLFPIAKDDPMIKHISYALDAMCPEAYDPVVEWDNYDKRVGESQLARVRVGATLRQLNLFRYPWDIPDNTYDILWMSHIVEHIPHEPRLASVGKMNGATLAEQMLMDDYDGWFIFFAECWRILKPSGQMRILAPYGNSVAGMTDPTHTRYVLPNSFGYFSPNKSDPFDYALPYAFQQITNGRETTNGDEALFKFIAESADLVAQLDSMSEAYSALPDTDRGNEKRTEMEEQIKAFAKHVRDYSTRHFNQISEVAYSFTPVK